MSSVRDFIESLNKPAPELPDLEDDDNLDDGTRAGRSQKSSPTATQDEMVVGRRRLHMVADDTDSKYGAEVVSSKAVFGDYELSGLAQPAKVRSDDSESDEDSSLDDDDKEPSETEEGEGSDDDDMEEGASEQGLSDDQDDVDDEEGSLNDEKEKEDDTTIQVEEALAAVNLESQKKKGESIRKQLLIWDRLMHIMIKLHAALRVYNQLPRGKLAKQLLREADETTVRNYRQVRKNTLALLDVLLNAEDALLRGSKQTSGIIGNRATKNRANEDSEDEEVVSSPDEKEEEEDVDDEVQDDDDASIPDYKERPNASGDEEEEQHDKKSKPKRRQSLRHVEAELAKRHKRFEEFRNATLKKWDERTRLVGVGAAKSAKHDFSAFESVVSKQIAQIMADKHRLIRRTQMKRSDAERIGGNAEATYDVELFDDDDFYQQLLRDLIERKSADVVDPIEMSKQWLEMQKLRQKRSKKKKVDTKASKGRKIRYVVIPKLVNYYPSCPEKVKWTHETRNQLFKSLFAP